MIIIIFFYVTNNYLFKCYHQKVSLNKVIFDLGRLPFHLRAG